MRDKLLTYLHNLASFCIALFLLIFGWLFNNRTGWGIFYAIVSFFLIELLQLIFPLRFLKYRIVKQTIQPENEVAFSEIRLWSAHWFWVPHLRVQLSDKRFLAGEGEANSRNLKQPIDLELSIFDLPRGYYPQMQLHFMAADYFQIWEKSYHTSLNTQLYVLPNFLKKAGKKLAAILSPLLLPPQVQQDYRSYDFKRYRSYQNGDSLKTVDWKKTAKTGQLLVRENYPETQRQNILIFWGEANSNFESALSLFYSLVCLLDPHLFNQVIFLGQRDFQGKMMNHHWAALIKPFNNRDNFTLLGHLRQSLIVVFATGNSAKLGQNIERLKPYNQVILVTYQAPTIVRINGLGIAQEIQL